MFTIFAVVVFAAGAAVWAWILSDHPRSSFVLSLAVLVAAPVWAEYRGLSTPLPPFTLACIFLLPAILKGARLVPNAFDLVLGLFAVAALVAPRLGDTPSYASGTVFAQWVPAYLVGRLLVQRVGLPWAYRAIATSGAIVGAWALIEFAFGLHIFEGFAGTPGAVSWQEIQVRGPFARSEGAFGHSIALGGFLALAAPFVIAADLRPKPRTIALLLIAGGCVTSLSRGPIIGFGIAVILASVAMRGTGMTDRYRKNLQVAVMTLGVVAAVGVTYLFRSVSSDLAVSTAYRANLPEFITQDFSWFGVASNFAPNQYGQFFYRSFTSIDNAYILIGLQFGWLPLLLLVGGLAALAVRAVTGKAAPAAIALVSQIFVLATVALITQYSSAVWLVAGIAAAEIAARRPSHPRATRRLPAPADRRGLPSSRS